MKRKIDWGKYKVRQNLGFTTRYIQEGLEYDEEGWSIKDFPTPQELIDKEKQEINRMKKDNRYVFSLKQQPYATRIMAERAAKMKKLDPSKVKFHEFKMGVVIEYDSEDNTR